ncbi:hypothetical protein [Brevibacillus brevis]|uniref:Uncharacterized protein n=1 Tax=Brevibacillus brevis TaxID=1393 RepID=A0ABY9SYR1_BREBE|nr:hypothetical protein [Brevibacillus brevis]WNC12967.1 hypothetical protein RGB73_19855 [Brevibacillus brevis]
MKIRRLTYQRRNPRFTGQLRASYHILTYQTDEGFVPIESMQTVVLDRGALIVGRTPIHVAKFTEDHITWVQQSEGRYSSGHLYIHDGGQRIHGIVYQGTTHEDAVKHDIFGTVVKPVTYKTTITKRSYPPATSPSTLPADDWQEGLELTISYQLGMGDTLPAPKVLLGGEDITDQTTWKIDHESRTVLSINLDDEACSLADQLYKTASIAFDMYTPVPEGVGTIEALCRDTESLKETTVRFWKASPVQHNVLFAHHSLEPIAAEDVLAQPEELTINELMTILPDQSVNDDSNSMLMRNMKWAMGQDGTQREWLSKFFGQKPPVISEPNQQELVKQSLHWYQSQFAKAYLTKSFQQYDGANKPSHRLDDAQAKKLDVFLKEGLAQSKDFNIQHQGIFVDAYIGAKPRLRAYIQDGGEKWAKELYDVLTNSPQFVLMVNRISGAAGDPNALAPLNNFACLLTALQPSAELARNYYKAVMTGVVVKLVPQTSHSKKETIMQWLPTAMQELLRRLADGELPDEVDISKEEAKEMYEEYIKHQNEIASSLADLLQSVIATTLFKEVEQMEEGFQQIAQKYPKLVKASKLFLVVAWIGGIASIITALVKGSWDKMSDVEKAEFITQCTQTVVQAFDAVPVLYNGTKSLTMATYNKLLDKFFSQEQQTSIGEIGDVVSEADGGFVNAACQQMEEVIAAAEGAEAGAVGKGSMFAEFFNNKYLTQSVKALGAVIAAAMAGWSLWQLIDDIKKKGSVSTIVFDSLIFAANFLAAVCLVVDLFVTTSFLPIAGAVLAIAGMVLSVLANFFEEPDNPVDDFMNDVGIPFVDSLPAIQTKAASFHIEVARLSPANP